MWLRFFVPRLQFKQNRWLLLESWLCLSRPDVIVPSGEFQDGRLLEEVTVFVGRHIA